MIACLSAAAVCAVQVDPFKAQLSVTWTYNFGADEVSVRQGLMQPGEPAHAQLHTRTFCHTARVVWEPHTEEQAALCTWC